MSVEPATGRLTESGRHLLGLVMREATTNVLRHSQATNAAVDCRVEPGRAHLSVSNDGVVDRPDATPGTGLETLAERLATVGGQLAWRQHGDRFVVTATLPVANERNAQ